MTYNVSVCIIYFIASMYYCLYIIIGMHPVTASLAHRANRRLQQAYCKSTSSAYSQKFRIFMAFCVFSHVDLHNLSHVSILAFLEFLAFNNFTFSSVCNTLSAVKAKLSSFGICIQPFNDRRVAMFCRSLKLNRPYKPIIKSILDIETLLNITKVCDTMSQGYIFKTVYLFAFFSFFKAIQFSSTLQKNFLQCKTCKQRGCYLCTTRCCCHYKMVQNYADSG